MTPICDPIDRPIITSSGFDVDGVSGIPDFDGNGNSSNPPTINKTINSFVEYTNGDDSTTVQYRYFLESNSGEAVFSANPYIPQEDQSIPGESLNCEVLVTNSVGSTSVTIEMGVVYGLPPSIPENLNSFAIFDPAQGRSVLPNETVTITYNNVLTDPGDPPPHTIETIINGQSFLGTFISFSYDTLDNPTCSPSISRIEISNLDNIIPDTAFVFKNYDPSIQIVGVQGVPGHPCGEPLGSCCIAGELDTETGIQLGSCDQQTNEVCTALGGLWTQETDCPDCNVEENDGLPCCSQYGTGRCCCVQHDNSGLCVDSITYEDCHSEDNVVFANCGGSTEYPNRVWTYDVDCDSADSPPCVGPPTGRCCEFIPDGGGDGIEGILDGFVCTTGLEDGDCPRFPGQSTSWDWNFDGNCPDCRDPTQNNSDCCPTLGRCCSGGSCTPNQLRIDCPQSWDDTSNLCPDCGTDNPGPPCCVATGRCCFKYPSAAGDADVGQRRGSCSIETDTGCSAKFNSLNGIDGTKTFNIGEVCISCVDNTDSCCDDAATNGYACNGINCIPNVLQGAEPSNYVWNPSDDGTCPDCTDPDVNPPNNPSDCCAFGVPLLSIDSFTVDGQPYDATLNPIGVGSVVTVETTELNVQNVSYIFQLFDTVIDNQYDVQQGSKTFTVPASFIDQDIVYYPGKELHFRLNANALLSGIEVGPVNINFNDLDDYIHGIPPTFPTDVNDLLPLLQISPDQLISPPTLLSNGDNLYVGDPITTDLVYLGTPPSSTPTYQWLDINGDPIDNSNLDNYTISQTGELESCGVQLEVTLKNDDVGGYIIPEGAEVSHSYNIGNIVTGDGTFCGTAVGSCCIAGDVDEDNGINYGSCDQQTNEVCTALGGLWTEDTPCPDCNDGTVGLPCCTQVLTGRCCCVKTDNTGLCVEDVTSAECNVTDVRFANCIDEDTDSAGAITWTVEASCPVCGGDPNPPCCAPLTGRCCEVVLENANGIPVGVHCEIGLESVDCPQFLESDPDNFLWTSDGSCVTCANPELNFGLPCCDPLGRCCLRSGDLNEITYNITESSCEDLQDAGSWLTRNWTVNDAGSPSIELECSIPSVAAANPNCCPTLGLCCFKTANADGETSVGFRLGQCHPNITDTACTELATSQDALSTSWSNADTVCPNCGNGSNINLCCDDIEPAFGRCCVNGSCVPSQFLTDCPNDHDDSSEFCPDCTDPDVNPPNNPSDCCAFGVPLLSIDSFTVDGQPYDATLNPIGVGSEVAVSTTELNVQNVSYRFYITDSQGGNPSIDLTNGNTKTLTVPETQTGISGYLPGYELNFEVTADSQLEPNETLSADLLFHDDDDYIHGRPPVFPDDINTLYPDFRFVFTNEPIDPPITLSYNDAFLFPGTVISNDEVLGIPPAAASYEWTDANDNFISDALFYTISSDGVVENCGLGLQVTLENNVVGARVIPGGAEITKIYVVGSIQGGPDTLCGTPIGRCCVQGNFVEAGTLLSDGQQWGITFSSCSIKDEPTCIADGGEWDDDINDCSVCLTAPPSQGAPCCDEIPGRCCENNSCDDFVLFIDCGGTWTSYMDDTNVCEDACPDAGAACGCATTGACCCGSGFSTPCHDGYTEEECADINFNPCAIGKGGEFQGYGTSCPTDIECVDGDGAADCCPVDEIVSSWTGRVGSPARNTCTTISGNNLADVHRCDGVSREGDRSLQWTSPCDYREILSLPGFADVNPRCEIDSICSCYVAAPLLSNIPYCNGPNTGGRKHEFGEEPSLNLVALCEQKVCASDIFCCDVEWDSTCAKTAQELCGADNIFSGEVDGDELAGAIAESKAVFLNYDNTCSGGPGNFTPCIGTPVYPDQGDYTIIRTWSDCRCNFLHPPASTDHTNCLNGLL